MLWMGHQLAPEDLDFLFWVVNKFRRRHMYFARKEQVDMRLQPVSVDPCG